jgi:hypothetical protein
MNMSLLIPEGDNLVTYYVLPLVGLNKNSFGKHFGGSYIAKDGLRVYVELSSNMTSPLYKSNPNYISEMVYKGKLILLFSIPSEFIADIRHFIFGRYSQMGEGTKKIIYATSTLPYNKTMGSFMQSHPILQALDKTKTLRTFLIDHLRVETIPDSAELITRPEESWFIEYHIT